MKVLIFAVLLIAGGYFYYTHYYVQAANYSLADVEQKPIPKNVFYKLWNDSALKACADAKSNHNLTPEECREKVKAKFAGCEASIMPSTPDPIDNNAQARRLAKTYLACVTPYFYCNGIEVKTEDEARQHCK